MPPKAVKRYVMNETKATMTGTGRTSEARSPQPAVHPIPELLAQTRVVTGQDSADGEYSICKTRRTSRRLLFTLLAAAVTTTAAWSVYRWWENARNWVKTDRKSVV